MINHIMIELKQFAILGKIWLPYTHDMLKMMESLP